MKIAREDFEKRKIEINQYFDFLSKLDNDKVSLSYEQMGIARGHKLDDELKKILKANGFLLIYNLVEACCRNSLWEILFAIQAKKLTLKKLSDDAQMLWIKSKMKNFKESKSIEKLEKHIHDIALSVINNAKIEFQSDSEFINLAGNIDKKKIRELAKIYGFVSIVAPEREKAGEDLVEIKNKRNHLAHGRITFAECGKQYSIIKMVEYKDNAILYLEAFLENVEDHIKTLKFEKSKAKAA